MDKHREKGCKDILLVKLYQFCGHYLAKKFWWEELDMISLNRDNDAPFSFDGDMNLQSLDVEAAEILRQELENADVQIQ